MHPRTTTFQFLSRLRGGGSASSPGDSNAGGRAILPTAHASRASAADDSSRANINNPGLLLPQPHSTQSFLSASATTTSSSSDTTPRPSHSHNDVGDHQGSGGGGRRLRRGSRTAAAQAGGGSSAAKDSRPNKPLVAIDRGRRCKGPVLDGGLSASPSPHHAGGHHYKGGGVGGAAAAASGGPQLTRARLEKERSAFWDTRVTGHAEIWGAVRLAAELVRGGDVASAQGVLDATGATCPTGELWRGVFDEWGTEYRVPEWAMVEPVGVVEVDEEGEDGEGADDGEQSLAEEKGKGKMGEVVKLKARLSDRGTDIVVQVGMEERVSSVISRIAEAAKLPTTNRIRIAYLGKIFRENDSLAAQGYSEGHVVNALVF
ncbi:hypothetical protein SLS56_007986 [Neofusicoccum ribis]|uniref:Ubiquitin-like domain-containing protein n=1 Tax=Neofusicoccum ribis TaxID=45134 RepID=A0ABR3SLD0_9PEZI